MEGNNLDKTNFNVSNKNEDSSVYCSYNKEEVSSDYNNLGIKNESNIRDDNKINTRINDIYMNNFENEVIQNSSNVKNSKTKIIQQEIKDYNDDIDYTSNEENFQQSSKEEPFSEIKNNIFLQREPIIEDDSSSNTSNSNSSSNELTESNNYNNHPRRPLDDPEECKHLKEICSAFFNYQVDSLRDVARMERDFNSIPKDHLKLLKYDYRERLDKLRKAIWKNYLFILKIVKPYSNMFKFFRSEKGEVLMEPLVVSAKDVVKMRSTLKLFIRDWTKEVIKIY